MKTYEVICHYVKDYSDRREVEFSSLDAGKHVELKILSLDRKDMDFVPGRRYTIEIKEATNH